MSKSGAFPIMLLIILGDLLAVIVKVVAGAISGSAALFASAVHSLLDVVHQLMLLLGWRHASGTPDRFHPFGYGREAFFWSYSSSLLILGFGAVLPITGGFRQILNPLPIEDMAILYLVMLSVLSFQLVSMVISLGAVGHRAKGIRGMLSHFRLSRQLWVASLWREETLNLVSTAVVIFGIILTDLTGDTRFDGLASVIIGVLILLLGYFLARDGKELLAGEVVTPGVYEDIVEAVEDFEGVESIAQIDTLHMKNDHILVRLTLNYDNRQREKLIRHVKKTVPVVQEVVITEGKTA